MKEILNRMLSWLSLRRFSKAKTHFLKIKQKPFSFSLNELYWQAIHRIEFSRILRRHLIYFFFGFSTAFRFKNTGLLPKK
jgi:hypothetical protein